MYKRLKTFVIVLVLICCNIDASNIVFTTALNSNESGPSYDHFTFNLSHKTTPISEIIFTNSTTDFDNIQSSMKSLSNSGVTADLVKINIKNNTKDGWKLIVRSKNGSSFLKSVNDNLAHGEEDMPYTLLCDVTDNSNASMEAKLFSDQIPSSGLTYDSEGNITLMDIDSQSSSTKSITFDLKINIITNGLLSGHYDETIYYDYIDN